LISVELSLLFVVSIIFSLLYELSKELSLGMFAHICWWVFAFYWLVVATNVYIVSLLFWAIGFIYMMRWFIQLIDVRRVMHQEESDLD